MPLHLIPNTLVGLGLALGLKIKARVRATVRF